MRDPEGKTVVTGATDVTNWVEGNLLHMDRTAFEATFYAKQKELRFFAHDDGISRVRRVSRMLGISGVEAAQKLLRDDRNDLRSEARVIEGRLAEANLDELNTGLEAAKAECKRLEDELEKDLCGVRASRRRTSRRPPRPGPRSTWRTASTTGSPEELQGAEADRRRAEDRAADAEHDLEELARAGEGDRTPQAGSRASTGVGDRTRKTRRRPPPVGAARAEQARTLPGPEACRRHRVRGVGHARKPG